METYQVVAKAEEKQLEDTFGNIAKLDFRCKKCNKLLFKGKFIGKVEIVCNRCKNKNVFDNKK